MRANQSTNNYERFSHRNNSHHKRTTTSVESSFHRPKTTGLCGSKGRMNSSFVSTGSGRFPLLFRNHSAEPTGICAVGRQCSLASSAPEHLIRRGIDGAVATGIPDSDLELTNSVQRGRHFSQMPLVQPTNDEDHRNQHALERRRCPESTREALLRCPANTFALWSYACRLQHSRERKGAAFSAFGDFNRPIEITAGVGHSAVVQSKEERSNDRMFGVSLLAFGDQSRVSATVPRRQTHRGSLAADSYATGAPGGERNHSGFPPSTVYPWMRRLRSKSSKLVSGQVR